jgi:hypothetical protein
MRLWSLHPKYLDAKGLVGLWREGLLARKVLKGHTKGYINHPQLERFKKQNDAVSAIDNYLWHVYEEAEKRGYNFNKNKIGSTKIDFNKNKVGSTKIDQISVTEGQMAYELEHLKKKLRLRDPEKYGELANITSVEPNPIFKVVKGKVESWEKR